MVDDKLMGALAYVFGWLSGLIVYFVKKESKFVRFHAIQSILLSVVGGILATVIMVGLWIVGVILAIFTGGLGMMVIPLGILLLMAACVIITVLAAYKAYKGLEYKLPFIGNLAEKYSA